jgi:undecaprenyl-diphosphatase
VLRLVVAVIVLLVLWLIEWLFDDTLVAFTSALLNGLHAVPHWIVNLVVIATRILAVVVLGAGFVWTLWHGRWRMLLTVALAGGAAAALVALRESLVEPAHGSVVVNVSLAVQPLSSSGFPTTGGLAVMTAVLTAAAPWLSRRWRRAGSALIAGLFVTRLLTAPISFDVIEAVVVGWLCGAAVLVALGAPSRRPTRRAVMDGLAQVGRPMRSLERAGVDARGSTPYFGVGSDGTKLFVKALGEDERSADLLFRLYRSVQPRQFGDERPFSSLRRTVEHEALVALAARDLGVRTPRLCAFASAEPNGYVLAYEAIDGKSLDRLDPADVTDALLADIWRAVGQLQLHRVAHRDLRLANIFRDDDGRVWLIDFGFSELAASDLLLATDVAELLASSCLYVGVDRAIDQAQRVVAAATLSRARDRLRPGALSGATRTAYKARPGLLDQLRAQLPVQ